MIRKVIETDKTVCHASFEREPTPEVIEAIKSMIDIAYSMDIKPKANKDDGRKLGDYDIWYEPCGRCGYDTGKSSIPSKSEGNKTCWKCGNRIYRDYSERALKK